MTDLEKVLGKTGARKFWDNVWRNVKILTGDVAYNTKGDLQTQINAVADTASTAKTTADAAKTAAEDAKVAAGEIVTDTTDKFDSTKDYAVGDYVIYDNKAWKFTTVHPAGAWDESHVEQTNILAEIAAQNKNFDALNAEIGTGIQISNELQTITLPFTAQSNVMMQIKIAHTVDDVVHYCYLKSNFYGNNYYSFVGAARGGATVEWFPVKKGDTISFQGASGATATYAVFS